MSRGELADAVNAALDELYPGRDLTAHYVDSRWIGKLERGEHRWPSDERRTALRHLLDAPTDASIGLYSPRRTDAGQQRPDEGRSGSVALAHPPTGGLVPVGRTATAGYVGVEQAIMAVRFASLAVEQAPQGVAQVRAFSILARAWSHRGSADEVRRALDAADVARSAGGSDELHDLIGGEFGYALPQQARSASTAWLQIGQADEATTSARQALDALAGAALGPWSTVEAEARVDLATCQFLTGDVSAARETLVSLWTMPPDWRRVGLLRRVRRVQDMLSTGHWRSMRAAREVAEAAAVFAATASTTPEPPPA